MRHMAFAVVGLFGAIVALCGHREASAEPQEVGEAGAGRVLVPTNQVISPAGRQVTFPGRPTDLALLPDRRIVVIKNLRDLILLDAETGAILQTLHLPSGGHSVAGLALADDGGTIFTSATASKIHVARRVRSTGNYHWSVSFVLPGPKIGGEAAPTGLALKPNGEELLALSGRGNTLHRLDPKHGRVLGDPIPVGVAPFGVVAISDKKCYVSNWGGDPPKPDDPQALSSRTPTKIDPRTGAAASGSVSVVDLETNQAVKSIPTGLHPSGMVQSADHKYLYVACANSDTVDVIDTTTDAVVETIAVRPEARLPFGSGPNALASRLDGGRLYVANGTNNAVAVVASRPQSLGALRSPSRRAGPSASSLPAGIRERSWSGPGRPAECYPPRSPTASEQLIVANIKGQGSRSPRMRPASTRTTTSARSRSS